MNDSINKSRVCEILSDMYPTDGERVIPVKQIDKAYEKILQLPSAQSEQQWIPCSERLPGSEEYVWAVYKNSLFPNGKSHHKTLKYDGEKWIDENGYRYLTANVTHWKYRDPLPEPYKGD